MSQARPQQCEKEMLVARGARTGLWDPELEQHAATCPACSEAALAARMLNEMRATDEAQARIPDPVLIWWEAQLLAKRQAGEKATQPIHLVERFACAWAVICAAGACLWQWHAIRDWLGAIGSRGVRAGADSLGGLVAHFTRLANQTTLARSSPGWSSGLLMAGGAGILLLVAAFFAVYFSQSQE
ncbi:MAG TPA: hypothetical protein VEJ67_15215 [Candidatus Cybelea sp.]|nr:hypothetical protein [Candidatus Cybelea sp.]